jgi:hypothetical protein
MTPDPAGHAGNGGQGSTGLHALLERGDAPKTVDVVAILGESRLTSLPILVLVLSFLVIMLDGYDLICLSSSLHRSWPAYSTFRSQVSVRMPAGNADNLFLNLNGGKGTPANVIDRISEEINAMLADPKMKARLADFADVPMPITSTEFGKVVAEKTEKWAKVIGRPTSSRSEGNPHREWAQRPF